MRNKIPLSKKGAEKLFRRKASPDSNLSAKDFLRKKLKKTSRNAVKNITKDSVIRKAPGELYNAQRAKYEKAMNRAMKKGGSNGVGVGY
jgi:hypothetical protein